MRFTKVGFNTASMKLMMQEELSPYPWQGFASLQEAWRQTIVAVARQLVLNVYFCSGAQPILSCFNTNSHKSGLRYMRFPCQRHDQARSSP